MMIGVPDESADPLPAPQNRLERLIDREVIVPAWRRHTTGEQRWPSAVAIFVMIGLQYLLPDRLTIGPRWFMPVIELVLIAVLGVANPVRIERGTMPLRALGLVLIGVASLGNAWSVAVLAVDIAQNRHIGSASALLSTGGAVYVINILTFAVWYWELDRGGPPQRALGTHQYPDFLFPQMTAPDMARRDWEPLFIDYLYVAITNATAFSPTDTLPLSRWAKGLMGLQAVVALITAALVVARAVNALA
jgi:hypothetical protein